MLLTILTITFNAERFLEQTLESVAQQKRGSFEHLLWDGGSSDNTMKIAQAFKHVKVISGKDRGIADAMNQVAQYAKGKYLLFLHADDLLACRDVIAMIQNTFRLHPGTEWIYGRAHIINAEGKYLRTTPYEPFSAKRLRRYNFMTHPATIVSKNLFVSIGGFQPMLRYCMDYDLWLRLARFTSPIALASPFACFREHQHSLSTAEPLNVAREAYLVRNCYVTSCYERFRSYRTWRRRRNDLTKLSHE